MLPREVADTETEAPARERGSIHAEHRPMLVACQQNVATAPHAASRRLQAVISSATHSTWALASCTSSSNVTVHF